MKLKTIKKKLSKTRVGSPVRVVFYFKEGTVTAWPKRKEWKVQPKGKKPIIHSDVNYNRCDVTKHKAKHYLKLAIIGMLRNDDPNLLRNG